MKTPFLDQLIEEHQNHIESVEAASYAGIPKTRKQLEELEVIKRLLLHNVSQQRELLIDFMKSLNGMEKHLINKGEFENVAKRFLSINCG